MSKLALVIGNKKYSSWSLRPWILLRHAGAAFDEIRIPLYRPESKEQILRYSPSGKVPLLIDGEVRIWESLAICEYVAERFPQAHLWPDDGGTRAVARAVASEMHAGFAALRMELPMNCRGPRSGVVPSAEAQADVDRITSVWRECRQRFGAAGPWLFGDYSVADAMFAPVAIRFSTYAVPLPSEARSYVATALADPPMRDWIDAGLAESETIEGSERGQLAPEARR
jgi:glutathione S-transferase